jgi:hypothetical protein
MPDYYPVIARAVSRLGNNSSEARQALYGQARAFLDSKLSGRVPPFAESDKNRARSTLEAAISVSVR